MSRYVSRVARPLSRARRRRRRDPAGGRSPVAQAQSATPFEVDSSTLAAFKWRLVGPANTMGRVSDVTGIPSPSKTLFVAAAGGGIWKSTNNGTTWRPVFDHERVVAMGMLAIAPSDTHAGLGRDR